jgi:hypothetical protein
VTGVQTCALPIFVMRYEHLGNAQWVLMIKMPLFTQWEITLLSNLLSRYEESDFNCGATEKEQKNAKCPKVGNDDIHLNLPCGPCKYRKRFVKLCDKVNDRRK